MELGRLEYLQALVTEFQVTDSLGNPEYKSEVSIQQRSPVSQ